MNDEPWRPVCSFSTQIVTIRKTAFLPTAYLPALLCVSVVYSETVVQEDFEMMVKLNEPDLRNGNQALWVHGVKIIHEKRFRWRDSEILKLNLFKFGLYIHYCERDCTYWVDDLLISTGYVQPKE